MKKIATFDSTANIALVKYWGKRDEELILPQEGSLSVTMDETLRTRTSVLFSEKLKEDQVWINNQRIDLNDKEIKERFRLLDEIRKKTKIREKALIVSLNCFPSDAGFASSAAGLSALALCLVKASGLKASLREISIFARLGSGSACRSVLGGFVEWKRGKKKDGSDSFAHQIAPASHWPDLINLIALVSEEKKKVSSRAGMRETVKTSILYPARLKYLPSLLKKVKKAILKRDFQSLAQLIMRESNNLHAVMLDTWPPLFYLNELSKEIIFTVLELNKKEKKNIAAFTFDAGPNAHIFTLKKYEKKVKDALLKIKGVKKILVAKIGSGPKEIQDPKGFLLDPERERPRESFFNEKKKEIVVKDVLL
ncbi:MAG: diphosphomevalonate decarboxylase [Minisyncoccales bacterium]